MFQFTKLPPLSLYVHIPWCLKKCPYCDFNSHAVREEIDEVAYVNALLADLEHELPGIQSRPLTSIFIGGGTPSLFSPESISHLLEGIISAGMVLDDIEITMEANPGTFEQQKFSEFHEAGVNRLSIGIQSFNDSLLQKLGRVHDGKAAQTSVEIARQAGFDNINLDLMFGLPGQGMAQCRQDIETAISLQPNHISYYQLTLEPNTLFYARPPTLPVDDALWEMQQNGQKILDERGYTQYEVSAYAQTGRRCVHNLNYWQFGDYIGIGAGAHGKITNMSGQCVVRRKKFRQPKQYGQEAVNGAADGIDVTLSAEDVALEFMMNSMRLTDGVSQRLFGERAGLPVSILEEGLSVAVNKGLIITDNAVIRPTPLGAQYLNDLLEGFLPRGGIGQNRKAEYAE